MASPKLIRRDELLVLRKIHEGLFFEVYHGLYGNQHVTIKFPNKHTGADLVARDVFKQEVRVCKELNHPNVVQLVGYSAALVQANAPLEDFFIVSEDMCNGSMEDYIKCKQLSVQEVIRAATDVAKGLEHLHQRNIIHRDVKLQNFLVDERSTAKLGGLSFSKAGVHPFLKDMVVATEAYMAPEVLSGKAFGTYSDVYSFGVCLVEMYQWVVLAYRHSCDKKAPKWCPRGLKEVMKRCLKQDPHKRPAMSQVVKMLESIDPFEEIEPRHGLLYKLTHLHFHNGHSNHHMPRALVAVS